MTTHDTQGAPLPAMAVIGNCTLAALIDQRASILWACWPRIDGDPLFSALVGGKDPQRGVLRVDMDNVVTTSQTYERNTAIPADRGDS